MGQSNQAESVCEAALSSPITSESCAVLPIHLCCPFLCASGFSRSHRSETTATSHNIRQSGATSLILEFLILPWDKRHAMSSIPVIFSPIPEKHSILFLPDLSFGLV